MSANSQHDLGTFFSAVQLKALRQAQFATGSFEEAEDIVQEAMIRLGKLYQDRSDKWPQLFHRILQNLIRDWYRKRRVQQGVFVAFGASNDINEAYEGIAETCVNPDAMLLGRELDSRIQTAIAGLPLRQQQAFLLRTWWNFDVKETANAMACGEGSVKTHYHRAVQKLREMLQEEVE